MTPLEILLIGAGGHAQACIEVIEHGGCYQIAGLIGTAAETGTTILGYPVLGSDADLPELHKSCPYALVTLGQLQPSPLRRHLFERAMVLGFQLPAIIAADAIVSRHASVGTGSIVMHGSIISAGVRIGRNCILNSRSLVEHGAVIGDHCHIATGAIVNGNASIGTGSTLGSGSILREGRSLGTGCMIGMGLSVRHDLPDNCVFTGYRNE